MSPYRQAKLPNTKLNSPMFFRRALRWVVVSFLWLVKQPVNLWKWYWNWLLFEGSFWWKAPLLILSVFGTIGVGFLLIGLTVATAVNTFSDCVEYRSGYVQDGTVDDHGRVVLVQETWCARYKQGKEPKK